MTHNKALLVILDGWGLGPDPARSALAQANTPTFDRLMKDYPHSTLVTYGDEVGLPTGQMGNSEVGHLNIGAGRVVHQELARINHAIESHELAKTPSVQNIIQRQRSKESKIHLIGLYSDGGVHSHTNHFKALIDIFDQNTDAPILIHAFLDGRDTDPKSGIRYIKDLEEYIENRRANVASVIGRYYAMDRDKRWERVQLAYQLLVHAKGQETSNFLEAIKGHYQSDETDEFMPPIFSSEIEDSRIQPGDEVVFVNFRTDRPRQLTQVLVESEISEYQMEPLDIELTTMTQYDESFINPHVIFNRNQISATLGEYISRQGLTQLRAAETEKYAHVTYFLNGGEEEVFKGEKRILVPSPKVATYDLQPEMSAYLLTDAVCENLQLEQPDFVCINFANTDMVGHTGVFKAAIQAAEAVDENLNRLLTLAQKLDYRIVIIADHGNSDFMINDDGSPHTAHTTNPVPCIILAPNIKEVKNGKLADVAPTIIHLMNLPPNPEMTGNILFSSKL